MKIIRKHISDPDIVDLIEKIVESFHSTALGKGLPLGNLTSQLLVNVYMNEFDQYMKHVVKAKYYIRYADDFVIISRDRDYLFNLISRISNFLWYELKLELHPDKVFIKTVASGVDFLGWIHFSDHRVLRTTTERRATNALIGSENISRLSSYRGHVTHGNEYDLQRRLEEKIEMLIEREDKLSKNKRKYSLI
jgi:hypothetical protein